MANSEGRHQQPQLPIISEKRLSNPSKPQLSALCSPHDLVAVPTDSHDVVIYRINGQIAFTIKRKAGSDAEITAVQWKPNGASVAVGWSDGTFAIHSGENGRLLHQGNVRAGVQGDEGWKLDLSPDFPDDDDDDGQDAGTFVKCFGWGRHESPSDAVQQRSKVADSAELTADDWYDGLREESRPMGSSGVSTETAIADLPQAITMLDPMEVLPRLSAIPTHGMPLFKAGAEGSKFSSQAATDMVFEAGRNTSNKSVDVLLLCDNTGHVQVLMDESVALGTCNTGLSPLRHASNPLTSTHAVLCEDESKRLKMVFLDLPVSNLSSPLLHIMTTNTKRTQNLLSYVTHTVRCIQHDFGAGLAFPSRLVNNINSELEEKSEGDLVSNLFHLAMTGDFTPTMLEWLTDVVKEPNHKRWHVAVDTMYTHIQNHVFLHLLPALDRLSIAVTTIRGHAKFREDSSTFDVNPQWFTIILSSIDALRVVAQKLQLIVMEEMREFRAFSRWLKVMIEVAIAGSSTKSAAETEEREFVNLDYALTLAYIKNTLMKSRLNMFLESRSDMKGTCSKDAWFTNPLLKSATYDNVSDELKQQGADTLDGTAHKVAAKDVSALLNLPTLTTALSGNVRACIERITKWQSGMLKAPSSFEIGSVSGQEVLDMSMTVEGDAGRSTSARVVALFASTKEDTDSNMDEISLCQATSTDGAYKKDTITLPKTCSALDAAFLDGRVLLILCRSDVAGAGIMLLEHEVGTDSTRLVHRFATLNPRFNPRRLLAGGRKGKEVCVVFDLHGRDWQVLDVSSRARQRAAGAVNHADMLVDGMDLG